MLTVTGAALQVAPLRWIFYYNRGLANDLLNRPIREVPPDFAISRFLMPNWPGLYLKKGGVLLAGAETDPAFAVWKEGIERVTTRQGALFEMYPYVKNDAELRERWRELGEHNKDCILIFLQNANPTEFQIELTRVLVRQWDPHRFYGCRTQAAVRALVRKERQTLAAREHASTS